MTRLQQLEQPVVHSSQVVWKNPHSRDKKFSMRSPRSRTLYWKVEMWAHAMDFILFQRTLTPLRQPLVRITKQKREKRQPKIELTSCWSATICKQFYYTYHIIIIPWPAHHHIWIFTTALCACMIHLCIRRHFDTDTYLHPCFIMYIRFKYRGCIVFIFQQTME